MRLTLLQSPGAILFQQSALHEYLHNRRRCSHIFQGGATIAKVQNNNIGLYTKTSNLLARSGRQKTVPITLPLSHPRKQARIAIFGKLQGSMGSFRGCLKRIYVPPEWSSNSAFLLVGRGTAYRHLALLHRLLGSGLRTLGNSPFDGLYGNASLVANGNILLYLK